MARLAHEHLDAREYGRALVNLELSRYGRRLKQAVEDYIAEKYGEATAKGLPFDHEKVGRAAVQHALQMYNVEAAKNGGSLEKGKK